jgi:hypothetical protein
VGFTMDTGREDCRADGIDAMKQNTLTKVSQALRHHSGSPLDCLRRR